MYKEEKIVGIIPARAGSKGIPRKNVKQLSGRPLIYYSINAATNSKYIDRIIVSTDDTEIVEVAEDAGAEVPFIRPASISGDQSSAMEVLEHAREFCTETDLVVLLQPTSPFRTTADIDAAIEFFFDSGADSCVSVTAVSKHPDWCFELDGCLLNIGNKTPGYQRQQLKPKFELNGAIYIARWSVLLDAGTFLMDRTAAYEIEREKSLDIDTPFDFHLAELLMDEQIKQRDIK